MISSLYSGNIGGDDLQKAVAEMEQQFNDARQRLIQESERSLEPTTEEYVGAKWWEKE